MADDIIKFFIGSFQSDFITTIMPDSILVCPIINQGKCPAIYIFLACM